MPENEKLVNLFQLEEKAKRLQRLVDAAREHEADPAPLDFEAVRQVARDILKLVG